MKGTSLGSLLSPLQVERFLQHKFSCWTSTLDVVATALDSIHLSYTGVDGRCLVINDSRLSSPSKRILVFERFCCLYDVAQMGKHSFTFESRHF